MSATPAPEECAICGAAIPSGAHACPECGADERTGWREQSVYDDLDLPDTEPVSMRRKPGSALFWKVTGLVLLLIMAGLVFRGRW